MAKAYVYIRYKPKPGSDAIGNVIEIVPMKKEFVGTLDMDTYMILVMDLNIPCGQGEVTVPYKMDFDTRDFRCQVCPFSDIVLCDLRKYKVRLWSAGDVFNPPKTKGRKWKIDITKFLNSAQISKVKKVDKTELEKQELFTLAATKKQPKAVFKEQFL